MQSVGLTHNTDFQMCYVLAQPEHEHDATDSALLAQQRMNVARNSSGRAGMGPPENRTKFRRMGLPAIQAQKNRQNALSYCRNSSM